MKQLLVMTMALAVLASCSKDEDPIIIVPPSNGSQLTLNGIRGAEAGTSAMNSVLVDFSKDQQYTIARDSWDLGFYTGADFRLIINNTTVAYAKTTSKTDINSVGSADTVGVKIAFNQNVPSADDFTLMDNLSGNIGQSLIAASAVETDNKVYILNRGISGGISWPQNQYIKLRVLRSSNGYTLQYAPLTATTFTTLQISKSGEADFTYVSFTTGATVSGFPAKKGWDLQWSYGAYKTSFGAAEVMYPFSDLVTINHQNGVQVASPIYASAEVAADAYTKFTKDSAAKYTYSSDRWAIGSSWRLTVASGGEPAGIRKNRFYVVKDTEGNAYKLKFVSAGIANDGGTRGKPQIAYELIK